MEGVRVEDFVPYTSSLHGVAFINIKFHLPGEFSLGYRIKVILQKGRSLMYIRNSMGPRTVPWGTPERTGWEEGCVPSETTLCDLTCKKI